jgi:hypothetical protein
MVFNVTVEVTIKGGVGALVGNRGLHPPPGRPEEFGEGGGGLEHFCWPRSGLGDNDLVVNLGVVGGANEF